MKLNVLKQWICDNCGEIINSPADGYVEWLVDENLKIYSFKIVHHAPSSPNYPRSNCYFYDGNVKKCDMSLEDFVGTIGLTKLLTFLDYGPIHDEDFKFSPRVKSIREFVELTRRLIIPYYEEARLYWQIALEDGFFNGANEVYIYLPDTLKDIILKYENNI